MKSAQTLLTKKFEKELVKRIVPPDHAYRKINKLINFKELTSPLKKLYSPLGQRGIPVTNGVKAVLLQFWEDYSDREMERAVAENIAIRWFCGFSLTDKTPDHTYFCKLRKRLGTKNIADLFNGINDRLRQEGLFGNIFYFIDASTIITKTALWKERDKAIADGHEKLNNLVVKDYAADSQARWGAKSKNNIWFGYKRHSSVDMRYGLIEKTTITPANVPDYKVVNQILPDTGYIFADKLYDNKPTDMIIMGSGCSPGTIRKKSNPIKNDDLNRWRSKLRMPYESTFSKLKKRARYRGTAKVAFQNFTESIVYNLKKALTYLPDTAYT